MIAKLTGILDSTGADWAIVDCGGVGYLVSCSSRTLARIGNPGVSLSLLIEMKVSEAAVQLFGFADTAERDWFRLLTTVQGVGARVALSLLSALSPDELVTAILAQDRTALARADGVGPKLASRLANELKDKVGDLRLGTAALQSAAAPAAAKGGAAPAADSGAAADAISALVNLGYKRMEAFTAVHAVIQRLGPEAPVGELIRHGLKELAP